ncbi:ABC transporter ATP-binding protein [Desulforapulum autotrophicum]|uniref:ABC transporter ATP-binding protein n=1 Tax=Desulforapulum autotrophicum TaxID=2296 RepID=UPI00031EB316|nr:ABC transporter ATP-binding protein [Desulforapulum autotrophicum]
MKKKIILELKNVNACYGKIQVLYNINMTIRQGELICLLGGNASGKSTTLKTILGIVHPTQGTVSLKGENINKKPTNYIIRNGVSIVPENRRIFPGMTVRENLEIGAMHRKDTDQVKLDMAAMLDLFPRLGERINLLGMMLSGGEQQMLAMARALLSDPDILLMDEPSMGLSPALVDQQFEIIENINKKGTTILMVEQNANMALSIADRGYVLQTGEIVLDDRAENLLNDPSMQRAYLGGEF